MINTLLTHKAGAGRQAKRITPAAFARNEIGTIKQFMEHLVRLDDDATVDVRRMALAVLDFNLRGLTTHQPA